MKTRILRRGKLAGGFSLLLTLSLIASLTVSAMVGAQPPPPDNNFWGTVSICSTLVDEGTVVTAKIDGIDVATTTVFDGTLAGDGVYGVNPNTFAIPGFENDLVEFFVLGRKAGEALHTGAFTIVNLDLQVTVPELTVAASPLEGGSVDTDADPPYACDDVVGLTAVPVDDCWEFVDWTGDVADPDSAVTTVTMDDDQSVTANFELIQYTLTVNTTTGGTAEGGGVFDCGTTVEITATPESDCYDFVNWTGDAVADDEAMVTDILVDGDKTVQANFVQVLYTLGVTAAPTEGGIVTGAGDYCRNSVQDVTATANTGWEFVDWTGDVADSGAASTTVTMDGAKAVVANFIPLGDMCELTVDADPVMGGIVTGDGLYLCDDDAAITATATGCYEFDHWTGDGIADPNSASTTVTVDVDKTVTAHFVGAEYDLTVVASPGGSGGVTGSGTFDCDELADITATPATDCWEFDGWTGDGITNPSSPTTTVLMDGDKTVTAHFVAATPDEIMVIDLVTGWNTFSTPISLHPCWDTWGELGALAGLDVEVVYYYDVDTKYWAQALDADQILPLEGYYIKMGSAGSIPIVPNPNATPPPSKMLSSGLNLIGLASLVDDDLEHALGTIHMAPGGFIGYTQVISPMINTPGDWIYVRGDAPPMLEVSKAYWVIMENPDELFGVTETPYVP